MSLKIDLTPTPQKESLYDRLGGIYAIAAVVDKFSDAILENPIVGKNSKNARLREWSRNQAKTRLPGLKWMRTLWVADISGGPYKFVATKPGACPLSLEEAHDKLEISPAEFNEVAKILAQTLDDFKVPKQEKQETLAAFSAHKLEVNTGFLEAKGIDVAPPQCPFGHMNI